MPRFTSGEPSISRVPTGVKTVARPAPVRPPSLSPRSVTIAPGRTSVVRPQPVGGGGHPIAAPISIAAPRSIGPAYTGPTGLSGKSPVAPAVQAATGLTPDGGSGTPIATTGTDGSSLTSSLPFMGGGGSGSLLLIAAVAVVAILLIRRG